VGFVQGRQRPGGGLAMQVVAAPVRKRDVPRGLRAWNIRSCRLRGVIAVVPVKALESRRVSDDDAQEIFPCGI